MYKKRHKMRPALWPSGKDTHSEIGRCQRWIINSRRADLSLSNLANLTVCSLHFEPAQYNNQKDIACYRLLPAAVPTIVNCANPPKSTVSKRKAPAYREFLTPDKRSKTEGESETAVELPDNRLPGSPAEELAEPKEVVDSAAQRIAQLEAELAYQHTVNNTLRAEAEHYKKTVQTLQKANKRCNTRNKVLEEDVISLGNLLSQERLEKRDAILKDLPDIPRALFEVLVNGGRKINWNDNPKALEISLAVFFKSPSAYSLLRSSGFVLAHPTTLCAKYRDVLQDVGLCPKLLHMLQIRATALSSNEKHVTLALDGMKLKPGLVYSKHQDQIIGYENFGSFGNTFSIADEAVVLMVRGLSLRWKQIIGYYAALHSIKSDTLSSIISTAVKAIADAGYAVDAVIMD
ncbi:THAP domain-containing protein 9 [Elysia marginata]|uniref:THAP domain-containing protein 9 n=1 Tax=Elysia marginata TaxID=1093978 RepID=A0AAV4FIL6_9GAST|nr:THAP domain-containing protein 9 [Elysia marginata]